MKLSKETINKLTRDALLSIFLYALPVLLMLLSFKITGKQPWKNKAHTSTTKSK